jgi:hypothetical protein
MIVLDEAHVVSMDIGLNLIRITMKKRLSSCTECQDDISILTQVSSGPDLILLCSDCYNIKYSKEIETQVNHDKKEKK